MIDLTSRRFVARICAAFVPISVTALLVGFGASAQGKSTKQTGPSLTTCSGFPTLGTGKIGQFNGTLVEGHPTALEDYSPFSGGVEAWEFTTELMYDPLVNINPTTRLPYPDLASAVPTVANGGITDKGLVYTFHLRPGVEFADGTPFSSADVVYTYKLFLNPKTASPFTPALQADIAKVSARGASTVVFRLKHATASFLYDFMFGIAPKHILDKYSPSQIANSSFAKGNPSQTFGTGPFRFSALKGDNEVILTRNTHYFCGEPALKRYVFENTGNSNPVSLLQSGQINLEQIDPTDLAQAKSAGLQTFQYETLISTNLLFNLSQGHATSSQLVRQALMYDTNRKAIFAAAVQNIGAVTNGVLDPKTFGYTNNVSPQYSYDPAKAIQLLTQAGWTRSGNGPLEKNGQPLQIQIWAAAGNQGRDEAAAIMQQEWNAIGVQATVNTEDPASLEARYQTTGDYDVVIIGLLHDLDPNDMQQIYGTGGATNYNHYSNPRLDALLTQGEEATTPAARIKIYTKAQDLVAAAAPTPILWIDGNVRAETKNVHNVIPNGIALDLDRPNGAWWWVGK